MKVIISYYLDRRILIPKFSYRESIEILKFSSWLLLSRISQIFLQNLPRLIIGKLISIDFLGGFKFAEQFGYFSNNIIKKFTTYISLPFFSKKFNNDEAYKKVRCKLYCIYIFSNFTNLSDCYIIFKRIDFIFIWSKMVIYRTNAHLYDDLWFIINIF